MRVSEFIAELSKFNPNCDVAMPVPDGAIIPEFDFVHVRTDFNESGLVLIAPVNEACLGCTNDCETCEIDDGMEVDIGLN